MTFEMALNNYCATIRKLAQWIGRGVEEFAYNILLGAVIVAPIYYLTYPLAWIMLWFESMNGIWK